MRQSWPGTYDTPLCPNNVLMIYGLNASNTNTVLNTWSNGNAGGGNLMELGACDLLIFQSSSLHHCHLNHHLPQPTVGHFVTGNSVCSGILVVKQV